MDKNEMIRESFDYLLRIEDALNNNVKVPYGDHSGRFFTREELLKDLKYCYSMLHKSLGE